MTMDSSLKLRQNVTTKHLKEACHDPHLAVVKMCDQVSNFKQELYYDKASLDKFLGGNINNVRQKDRYKHLEFDVKNPFTNYGVLPSQLNAKIRRKTNSAPPFPSNESGTGIIREDDVIATSLNAQDANLRVDRMSTVVVTRNSIENAPTTRKRYSNVHQGVELSKCSAGAAVASPNTSGGFGSGVTDLDDTESLRTVSDTLKSGRDSLDCFSSVALLQRLYSCTKNPYFAAREQSQLSYFQPHEPPVIGEEFVARAILAGGESRLCVDLFYDLESIATRPYKIVQNKAMQTTCPKYPRLAASPVPPPLRFSLCLTEEDKLVFRASSESARAAMRKAGMVSSYLHKPYDINDDFMLTDAEDYAILTTKFGRVVYSPKMADNKYMYRFVILTKEAQEAVEALVKIHKHKQTNVAVGGKQLLNKRFLTEYEIIRELGIQMSPGWQHFMYFKNQQRELVLRKPL